jgi:hypothetical protein
VALSSEYVLNYAKYMTVSLEQFQSSELSRNATKVFSAAEHSPVLVTRRDGTDLVLMSVAEADARKALLEFAAQLIAVTTDDRGTLSERMTDRFPWMAVLSPEAQAECAIDLVRAARASFATERPHLAIIELTAWRETAQAIADGLGAVDVDWHGFTQPVERPN